MQTNKSSSAGQNDDETLAQAEMLVDSITVSMTMQFAIELGLLDINPGAGQAVTAAKVAGELPVKDNVLAVDMVERILRLLVAFSVVSCSVDEDAGGERRRLYGLTPVGRHFVKDEDGVSMAPLMRLLHDKVFHESWYKIKDAVLEGGIAFNKAHGMSAFEYPAVNPRFNQVFNLAMSNDTKIIMKKVLQSYKGFENIDRLVDVGGGLGQSLQIILTKCPNIKGINFDLPHVTKHGLSHPGLEHMAGDMFEDVPSADALFMKSILHDWNDERCLKLLKNCHKAIPENGKVIVVESILSRDPETSHAAKTISKKDVHMMTQNPGGKERTKKEFLDLAMSAGFAGIRFECCDNISQIMEFYK